MSAQALADRVTALGLAMSRSTLADIENGRRKFITVAELLAIANALNAAPIMLVFPGPYTDIEVIDGLPAGPAGNPMGRGIKSEAIRWFCGESLNDRLISDFNAYEDNRRPLREARELAELEREKLAIEREILSFVKQGNDDQVELYTRLLSNINRKIEQVQTK
jgi:transcriptional regulator with XRE-family HTH domain